MICGTGKDRPDGAWRDVYRSLDHATAKRACKRAAQLGFPGEAVHFADTFIRLQELRHLADYSPDFQPSRADALEAIGDAKAAIQALSACKRKDRIAFAVLLLLNNTRH